MVYHDYCLQSQGVTDKLTQETSIRHLCNSTVPQTTTTGPLIFAFFTFYLLKKNNIVWRSSVISS